MKIHWILFLTISMGNVYAQQIIILKDGTGEYPLGRYFSILDDKSNKLSIVDVIEPTMNSKFSRSRSDVPNYGLSNSSFWLKVAIVDSTSSFNEWMLQCTYAGLEHVVLYIPSRGNNFVIKESGLGFPFVKKEIKFHNIIFSVPLEKNRPIILYINIRGNTSKVFPFKLINAKQLINSVYEELLFKGAFLGILLIMIIYNFSLFVSIRDITYLYYVLYVSCYFIYQSLYDGFAEQFLGGFSANSITMIITIMSSGFSLFWLLLTRSLLDTKKFSKKIDKFLKILICYSAIVLCSNFFIPLQIRNPLVSANVILFLFVGFFVSINLYKLKNNYTKIYIIAIVGSFAGFTLIAGRMFGVLPMNFWTANGFLLGTFWEITVLSFALSYRIKLVQEEKEKEKAIIRSNIAADLHDEIGSNLSSISILGRLVNQKISNDDEIKSLLEKISTTARESSESIRDIVWFINPTNDTSENLVARVIESASNLLHEVKYDINIPQDIFEVIPNLRIRRHIFLILKEAITNAARHSQASFMEINTKKNDQVLKFVIRDNGIGMDEEFINTGNGLINMRHRANRINAMLKINSKKNSNGTEIELILNLSN